MKFQWNEKKSKSNNRKHGVSFIEVCLIFTDVSLLSMYDDEHSDEEDRWISIGQDPYGDIFVVVHTYQNIPVHQYSSHSHLQFLPFFFPLFVIITIKKN